MTAWRQLHRFRADRPLRPWLFGIGYRQFLMAQRADYRSRRRERAAADLTGGDVDSVAQADAELDLRRALASLPHEQRAAVSLCLAADCAHSEAAEILGLPLGTVKSLVQRGRAKLLVELGARDE